MSHQSQLSLFDEVPNAQTLVSQKENQWFDRKSARITAQSLADSMIGFANADGGRIVVGIHKGEIEGVDGGDMDLNSLLQAAIDFSQPPVRHRAEFLECKDSEGKPNRLLVLDVEASETIHRNKKQECFLRVGDENRRLGPNEERELAFDKGESKFDMTLAPDVEVSDLDQNLIDEYAAKIGARDGTTLLRNRGLYARSQGREGVTQAGWLVMGLHPPIWSYIRYIKYLGTRAETGVRSNVVEDVTLSGNIPLLIAQARDLIAAKMGTVNRLGPSGRFEDVPVLPEFAWLEAIVNAVTHRSYSLQGDGVRVRDFEDRLEVESPGRLPGLVRVKNIRETRYSRNPHIARVLAEMTGYVRELNEGVKRMFDEMARYGLRDPKFEVGDGSVRVILFKQPDEGRRRRDILLAETLGSIGGKVGAERFRTFLLHLKTERQMRTSEIGDLLGVTAPTARNHMKRLESVGLVGQVLKSSTDPTRYWAITDHPFWAELEE